MLFYTSLMLVPLKYYGMWLLISTMLNAKSDAIIVPWHRLSTFL